jgi:cold-inducible RNA-binding protein
MRLVVENLSKSVTHAELNNIGVPYGKLISANVATTLSNGKSKGFGFLEFSNEDEARAAIAALNGKDLHGQVLKVSEANPRTAQAAAAASQHS